MYIEVERNINIHVHDVNPGGATPPVVLVHGWPLNHKMFEYQLNVLPHYGYRCIAVDLRGFGQSDKPWHGYSYDRLADDLRAVLDKMEIHDATLLGFSVGGAISIRYMHRHEGRRIRKLVLVDAAAPLFTNRPDYAYALPIAKVNDLIRQTYYDRPGMLSAIRDMFFNRNLGSGLLQWFNDLSMEASGHATIQLLASLRDEDLRDDIGKIHAPTAIFHGLHDQIVPYANGQVLHQGIAGSRFHTLYNSGHGSVVDEVEAFNAALLGFLKS